MPEATAKLSLNPPANVPAPLSASGMPWPTSSSTSIPVEPVPSQASSDSRTFYAALIPAVQELKSRVNEELSVWKEAVGDAEKGRDARLSGKRRPAEEDEDEEDDGEEEDAEE